jgi:hypothetical protein
MLFAFQYFFCFEQKRLKLLKFTFFKFCASLHTANKYVDRQGKKKCGKNFLQLFSRQKK